MVTVEEIKSCYHCGLACPNEQIKIKDKYFCCNGCKTVYEMLNENDLCTYYAIDEAPGISKKDSIKRNFDFLEDPELIQKLIEFSDGKTAAITFDIPQMHCSSCVWILENLYKFDSGVIHSEVNFKKNLSVK